MAHLHVATVRWRRGDEVFTDRRYSRAHEWTFDGGVTVPASASPHVVRLPFSREDAVDPEEALVAAAASCHMLTFLDFASRAGFRVDVYEDAAEGKMGARPDGRIAILSIVLRPAITFSGETRPDAATLADLHHKSHEACFIANTLACEMVLEPAEPVFV